MNFEQKIQHLEGVTRNHTTRIEALEHRQIENLVKSGIESTRTFLKNVRVPKFKVTRA